MTNEETAQVTAYISSLTAQHEAALENLQKDCTSAIHKTLADQRQAFFNEQRSRSFAQEERNKMEKAIHEIMKLCHSQSELPPVQVATYVRQIVNHYCPDWDIPF